MRIAWNVTAIAMVSLVALATAEILSLPKVNAQSGPPSTTIDPAMACHLINSECGTTSCTSSTGSCTVWNGCFPAPIGCVGPVITSPYFATATLITPVSQCVDTLGSRCESEIGATPLTCKLVYWSVDPILCAASNGCLGVTTLTAPCSGTLTP